MKLLPMFGLLIAACGPVPATAASSTSGRYEQLALAVGRDGSITGKYGDQQGQGATKTCTFALAGRLDASGTGPVTAWAGGRALRGRMVARGDEVQLTMPGAQDFPGCGLVLPPQIKEGLAHSKISSVPWTSMRIVSAPRARLHPKPGVVSGRSYVVRGDIVGVRAQRGTQLAVDYVSPAGRVTSGWIAAAETAPLTPPR